TTLPGVCSPVEAGEVARIARRRGGDLPGGFTTFRMTLIRQVIANIAKTPERDKIPSGRK
ncbi:MAG: hypothetical protein PUI94_05085, partial [Eubacteriales bacterium]|nr:hypothetical protein [Eubacteriales bacterium]